MKFAYADPPYIGQAKKHYSHDPRCAEVDHKDLVRNLCENYPDGWALSLSSPSLQEVLGYCPADVRVLSWVKPFCSFKKNVTLAYSWEPVILRGGRKRSAKEPTVKDHLIESITLKKGLAGAKPIRFCYWIFDCLGAKPGDQLDDLFPGTGIVSSSWENYITPPEQIRLNFDR